MKTKNLKIEPSMELLFCPGPNSTCDFCQQNKSGWCGKLAIKKPITERKLVADNYQINFWGTKHILPSESEYADVVTGETSENVQPLICADCIRQMANQIRLTI